MTRILESSVFAVLSSALLGSLWINIAGLGSSEDWLAEDFGQMIFLYALTFFIAAILVGVSILIAGLPAVMLARKWAGSSSLSGLLIFGAAGWLMANLTEYFLSPLFTGLNGWVTAPYAAIATLTFWANLYGLLGSRRPDTGSEPS